MSIEGTSKDGYDCKKCNLTKECQEEKKSALFCLMEELVKISISLKNIISPDKKE